MPDDDVVMTAEDHRALALALQHLETTARTEIAERIRTAREWGDLKENAEYHDAKNAQAILETRILRLRDQLLRARIVEARPGRDTIGLGSVVRLLDRGSGREVGYTLVSAVDADAAAGRLSVDSPVGSVLVGSRRGDVVEVPTPKGGRTLEVLSVE
jgi:transcription elongation factor GreA